MMKRSFVISTSNRQPQLASTKVGFASPGHRLARRLSRPNRHGAEPDREVRP